MRSTVTTASTFNINRPIFENVTAYADIYADWSTDPRAANVHTADFAIAWRPKPNFQVDVGIKFGLNSAVIPY